MNKKYLKETLVSNTWTNESLASIVKLYYDTKSELNQLIEKSNKYKGIIEKNQSNNENQFNLGEQLFLYNIVKNKIKNGDNNPEILELKDKMLTIFNELNDYLDVHQNIRFCRITLEDILEYSIDFNNLISEPPKPCYDKHFFIRLEKELKCINCGASTKNLNLTEEELDFLTKCAEKQNMLIKEATEEDIPFYPSNVR